MTDPNLLVVSRDAKRLRWLTHHVTSRWPNAQVTAPPDGETVSLTRLIFERAPDAVILQADFADEAAATRLIEQLAQLQQARAALHCIVLAENGDELSAVRAMKAGARDYLPLARLGGDQLLAAITAALAPARVARPAPKPAHAAGAEAPSIAVPGYAIIKDIAKSNFSRVFLARSERLRRNVVLKSMNRGESVRELEDAERFQREYEIISSISHRSIAEIYDFGSLPRHLYLAMEYFPCGDLRDRLRNPLSVDESLYYLRTIAEALRVIHVFGILHRDLKPANVMLREDNSPVLIDFGLARRSLEDSDTTGVGQVLGSPFYISPEQSQGHRVDARTDIYSLGVMFYEMLTGQRPYTGRTAIAVMKQHCAAPLPILPEATAAQQPLLDRLMAKNPAARYASAEELLADLGPQVAAVA
jgi:DNA-binding NarL/FixJ family response regulator